MELCWTMATVRYWREIDAQWTFVHQLNEGRRSGMLSNKSGLSGYDNIVDICRSCFHVSMSKRLTNHSDCCYQARLEMMGERGYK